MLRPQWALVRLPWPQRWVGGAGRGGWGQHVVKWTVASGDPIFMAYVQWPVASGCGNVEVMAGAYSNIETQARKVVSVIPLEL